MTPKINWNPSTKDMRWFGVVILIGFGLIGFAVKRHGHPETATTIWAISSAIGFLAIVMPPIARPFYLIWMFIALVMGSVMSRIVMGVIFYFVLSPVAIVFKLMKRDAINRRKPEVPRETYWSEHPVIDDKKYYEHLF